MIHIHISRENLESFGCISAADEAHKFAAKMKCNRMHLGTPDCRRNLLRVSDIGWRTCAVGWHRANLAITGGLLIVLFALSQLSLLLVGDVEP